MSILRATVTVIFLLAASVWDLRERKVPVKIIAWGSAAEIGVCMAAGIAAGGSAWIARALLGSVPGVLLLILGYTSGKAGPADGWILAATGAAENYVFAIRMLCASCLIVTLMSLIGAGLGKVKATDSVPFVPFLLLGYVICKLYVPEVL